MNLQFITDRYFSDFDDPCVINMGWCFVWAWMAHIHTGAQLWTWWNGRAAHAFIEIDGRFFDCDVPRGVDGIDSIPFFLEIEEETPTRRARAHTPEEFKLFWHGSCEFVCRTWSSQGLPEFPTLDDLGEFNQSFQTRLW